MRKPLDWKTEGERLKQGEEEVYFWTKGLLWREELTHSWMLQEMVSWKSLKFGTRARRRGEILRLYKEPNGQEPVDKKDTEIWVTAGKREEKCLWEIVGWRNCMGYYKLKQIEKEWNKEIDGEPGSQGMSRWSRSDWDTWRAKPRPCPAMKILVGWKTWQAETGWNRWAH